MSIFARIMALLRPPAKEVEEKKEPEFPAETAAARAAHAVADHRHEDALTELRAARGGVDEAEVLHAIGIALPDEAPPDAGQAFDALILALADALVARGDRKRACDQLRRARSGAARVLRADLLCEGDASDGDLDLALALYADALRDDLDTPGARERWERLRIRLGRAQGQGQPAMGATLLGPGGALPFTLVREVARGGSSVVYQASAALLQGKSRTIALKLAHDRKSARNWLAHEARVAIRFRGPGVIPIFDVDPEEGWLAMAWASGGSLRERLDGPDARLRATRPIAPSFVHELCAVLGDLHAAGYAHGDLKPANVLFDGSDRPWLGDFALARPFGEAATPGSAGYVSPERMAGAPCSAADDVFAFGKILAALGVHPEVARACLAPVTGGALRRPRDAAEIMAILR